MKLWGLIGAMFGLILAGTAQAKVIDWEVWADRPSVASLDVSEDGSRVAVIRRSERGGKYSLVHFETDRPADTVKALDLKGLEPISMFWKGNILVLRLITVPDMTGEDDRYLRVASFDPATGKFESLLRQGGGDPRNEMADMVGRLQIGGIESSLPADPDHVIIWQIEDSNGIPDYYKVNVRNGSRQLVLKGNDRFGDYTFDRTGNVRAAISIEAGGPTVVTNVREAGDDTWRPIFRSRADDPQRAQFQIAGFFNPDNPNEAVVLSDEETGFMQAYAYDVPSRRITEKIAGVDGFDIVGVLLAPHKRSRAELAGVQIATKGAIQRFYFDPQLAGLYDSLEKAFPGRSIGFVDASSDLQTLVISTRGPTDPGSWYLIKGGKASLLATAEPDIPSSALSQSRSITYTARDGREISGIVTIPEGDGPFPGIAMPHGGPWVRDYIEYDTWTQMLANRGFVVFQPNYRGSTNLGRDHWLAGDREWGKKMQDDVDDGMLYLAEQGIIDQDRMGFFGWSYGGYSAMVAATRSPNLYKCSAAGAGVSDLSRIRGGLTGSRFLREYQKPTIDGVSPLSIVDQVNVPMLIVHGDEDGIVPVSHSRDWVDGLKRGGKSHTYIEIEHMGHSPILYHHNKQWYPQLFEFFETTCGIK